MVDEEILDERRTRVLRAVVRDYIRTGEPVGSRHLAERHRLRVSPATIRNDMATLERLGFLTHPHTSAGRIPTDLGYRFYVDTLDRLPRLTENQQRTISGAIDERIADIEELMRKTANVLSRLTPYAAVALPPVVRHRAIVRVDLVPIGVGVLLLVVTDDGRVDRRALEVQAGNDVFDRVSGTLGEALTGLTYGHARVRIGSLLPGAPEPDSTVLQRVAEAFAELEEEPDDHVFIGGVGNIAGEDVFEHRGSLRRLFEALDEEASVLRFFRVVAERGEHLAVRIGQENPLPAMRDASVVLATYEVAGSPVGTIALIGPTRMEYGAAITTVDAVSRRLSRVIEALGA